MIKIRSVENHAKILPIFLKMSTEIGLGASGIEVPTGEGIKKVGYFLLTAPDENFADSSPRIWLLSGNNNPEFLKINETTKTVSVNIPSSDWDSKYLRQLG